MADPTGATPGLSGPNDTATGRAVRFAVYLTGGLVMLAFGVQEIASTLGPILNCAYGGGFCPGGFTQGELLDLGPLLAAGVLLVLVAIGLIFLARRSR